MLTCISEIKALSNQAEIEIVGLFAGTVLETDDVLQYLHEIEVRNKMLKKTLIIFSKHSKKRVEMLYSETQRPKTPIPPSKSPIPPSKSLFSCVSGG